MLFARLQHQYRQDWGIRNYLTYPTIPSLPIHSPSKAEGQQSLSQSANSPPPKEPDDTSYSRRSVINPYLELNELTYILKSYLFDPFQYQAPLTLVVVVVVVVAATAVAILTPHPRILFIVICLLLG